MSGAALYDDVHQVTLLAELPDHNDANESGEGNQMIIKKTGSSWVWHHIWMLKNGPMKNSRKKLCSYACKLCIDSGKKKFIDCLISLHNGAPANGNKHLLTCHKSVVSQAPDVKPNLVDSHAAWSGSATKNPIMANFLGKGNLAVQERVDVLLAQLIVNKRCPLMLAISDDMKAVLSAATYLSPGSYVPMTRGKLDKILIQMFGSFIAHVKGLIIRARAQFIGSDTGYTQQNPGFLTIASDGWDSEIKAFFGVSIFFIDPQSWRLTKLAVGLATPENHSAQACHDAALEVLSRYGIKKEDIFCSVNDTTNAAVSTGRLLSGEKGDCSMHMANLVTDHATGKKTRSVNRVVVDSFPACNDIRNKVRNMIKYITSKKAKARMKAYRVRNEQVGMGTIRMGIDNDTRIAGTMFMYQQLLRSRYTTSTFFAQEKQSDRDKYFLSDDEFEDVAQFEAVLRPMITLSMNAQVDSRPIAGTSWLNVLKAKAAVECTSYSVVDVTFKADDKEKWDATTLFKDLPTRLIPATQMNANAQLLRSRITKELTAYFPEPDDHQLVAMICDPVMFTTGIPFIRKLGHGSIVRRAIECFKAKVKEEAWRSWHASFEIEPTNEQQLHPELIPAKVVTSSDDFFSSVMAVQADEDNDINNDCVEVSAVELADEAIKCWMGLRVNWGIFLKVDQNVESVDTNKIAQNNCYYLSEQVNVLLWWRQNAHLHRIVSRIASRELARPDANGLQERVFSFCKLLDSPLRRNLSDDKFEMIALLAFNRQSIQEFDENDNPLCIQELLKSLHSSASAIKAAEALFEFFEIEKTDLLDEDLSSPLASMLAKAAEAIDQLSSKRRRTESAVLQF